jgi:two-component system sensor kinase FixL
MSGLLCLLQLLLWVKDRTNRSYLIAAIMALSAAANAFIELVLMQSADIASYQKLLQLENLAVYVLLVSAVWLISLRLKTARRSLALAIVALWSLALLGNFLSPGSLVYLQVTELRRQFSFWDEPFTVAIGEANPWVLLAHIGVMLILIYVIDGCLRAWRAGERRSSVVIGVGVVAFLMIGEIHSVLVDNGLIASPYMVSFAYLAVVLTLSYELVDEAVRAPRLAREIEAKRR